MFIYQFIYLLTGPFLGGEQIYSWFGRGEVRHGYFEIDESGKPCYFKRKYNNICILITWNSRAIKLFKACIRIINKIKT